MANDSRPGQPEEQPADRMVGLRIALNPVMEDAEGKQYLLGEIAAKVYTLPVRWTHVTKVQTDVQGREPDGSLTKYTGPDFYMGSSTDG